MKGLKFKNSSFNVSSIVFMYSVCLSLGRILKSHLVVADLFTDSLSGMILLYLAVPFFTLKVFLHEILTIHAYICACIGTTNSTNWCYGYKAGKEMYGNFNDNSECNVKGINSHAIEASNKWHRGTINFQIKYQGKTCKSYLIPQSFLPSRVYSKL